MSAFIGSVFSLLAGAIVEAFTADLPKKMALTISIKGFNVSFTVFAIATFIVKAWFFGF